MGFFRLTINQLKIFINMGLFDMFKSGSQKEETLSPIKIGAISLLYLMKCDGVYSNEEIGQLLSVLGGKQKGKSLVVGGQDEKFMDSCVEYVKNTDLERFLIDSTTLLTDSQKIFIIANQIDNSLSDGQSPESEQILIQKFINGWGIDFERIKPIFTVLEFKNDKKIFEDTNPKNSKNFKFVIDL